MFKVFKSHKPDELPYYHLYNPVTILHAFQAYGKERQIAANSAGVRKHRRKKIVELLTANTQLR